MNLPLHASSDSLPSSPLPGSSHIKSVKTKGSDPLNLPVSRLLKIPSGIVLARVPTCDVPQGYASVVPLPAASLAEILSSL
jgi:hypothetical protein